MEYNAFAKVILRTPLHSLKTLENVLSDSNLENTEDSIVDFFKEDKNREALYLGSPDLLQSLQMLMQGLITDKKQKRSLMMSLYKYFARSATRTTPFGIFAGCTVGTIGHKTVVELLPSTAGLRHSRLDMSYVFTIAREVCKEKSILKQLYFSPNSTLYQLGAYYRFIERRFEGIEQSFSLTEVTKSYYLQNAINSIGERATFSGIVALFTADGFDGDDAEEFVLELIKEQVIVHELEPSVCGLEFLDVFLTALKRLDPDSRFNLYDRPYLLKDFIFLLEDIKQIIFRLDQNDCNNIDDYQYLNAKIQAFHVPYDFKTLVQTDLMRAASECSIDKSVVEKAKQCLRLFNKLKPKQKKERINDFIKSFTEHYQDAEVPLLTVLDSEYGIGYAGSAKNHTNGSMPWDDARELLLNKLVQSIAKNSNTIEITDQDVSDFAEEWSNIPDTFSCVCSILQNEGTESLVITNAGNVSATNMLGRFCYSSPAIHSFVQEIADKENELIASFEVYAEINHLSDVRTGNISSRPNLRRYEIPLLTSSGLPVSQQLHLDDLLIFVKKNKIYLKSRRLNKIVLPRMSNSHNYNSGTTQPIYQFLGDLQHVSNDASMGFSWGSLEDMFNYLPRVVYKKNIISRAKWKFKKKMYAHLPDAPSLEKKDIVTEWKNKYHIPDRFVIIEFDHELMIDITNELSMEVFLSVIRKKEILQLEEFLFTGSNSSVKNDSGENYVNQFILSFFRKNPKPTGGFTGLDNITDTTTQRKFFPGDKWLYFKIYCGTKGSNTLLKEVVGPFIERLTKRGVLDSWHFLRYADPDDHIRLRIHTDNLSQISKIISSFYKMIDRFAKNNAITKVVVDTYDRELERYGRSNIILAEDFFYKDSTLILEMLKVTGDQSLLWLMAIKYMDLLLGRFQFGATEKKELLQFMAVSYSSEFNLNRENKKEFAAKFARQEDTLERVLRFGLPETLIEEQLLQLINNGLNSMQPTIDLIREADKASGLNVGLKDLLISFIHMSMNRLFPEKQRYNEMVLYNVVYLYYRAALAKTRQQSFTGQISVIPR